ncbi:MAG: hypothetical protein ACM3IJ_00650 [Candidatus Levyibacteriota bacterium]
MGMTPLERAPSKRAENARNLSQTREFFGKLFKLHPSLSVYYPGCGVDFALDDFLPPKNRYYLDKDVYRPDVVKGYFGDTPNLLDGEFDMLYLRDAHQRKRDFSEMLRVVRPHGLVVVNLFQCGLEGRDAMGIEEVAAYPLLTARTVVEGSYPVRTFIKK